MYMVNRKIHIGYRTRDIVMEQTACVDGDNAEARELSGVVRFFFCFIEFAGIIYLDLARRSELLPEHYIYDS